MKFWITYIGCLCGLCAFLFPACLKAQNDFQLHRFSVNEGMSQGIVQDIVQDANGYIWFSTWNGLNKFDGYAFRSFKSRPDDGNPSFNNRIIRIGLGASGNIWCRTSEEEVCLFDVQTEKFIDVLAEKEKALGRTFAIKDMIILPGGITWLVAQDGDCLRVNENLLGKPESVVVYNRETEGWHAGEIHAVHRDADGDEWILTDKGINIIGRKKVDCTDDFAFLAGHGKQLWLVSAAGRIAEYRNGKIQDLKRIPDVGTVSQVQAVGDSLLVLGTTNGLWLYGIPSRQAEQINLQTSSQPSNSVHSLFIDSKGFWWILTPTPGVIRFSPETRQSVFFPAPEQRHKRSTGKLDRSFVYEDRFGVIRVKHRYGALSYYDPESGQLLPYLNADGSSYDPLMRICLIDQQDNVWHASERDLFYTSFYRSHYKFYGNATKAEVRCMLVDKQNRFWQGTKDGRLAVYATMQEAPLYLGMDGKLSSVPVSFFGSVYGMLEDKEGNLWIGTRGQGLILARPVQGNPERYSLQRFLSRADDAYSISSNDIYAIYQDSRGHIWVGTYLGGLNLVEPHGGSYRFIHGGNAFQGYPVDYKKSKVRSIAECKGVMFVGASEGLMTFDGSFARPEEIRFYYNKRNPEQPGGLSCAEVMNIQVDSRQNVYLATFTGGINRLVSDNWLNEELQFKVYDREIGMLSELAMSSIEDLQGNLWFVMENYLVRYDPASGKMEHYGQSFFHRQLYFSEAVPVRTSDGHLRFGVLDHGVLDIDPGLLNDDHFIPSVVFEGLTFQGQNAYYSLANRREAKLEPHQRNVTFHFAALDYANANGIQYAYRLRGLDNDWTFSGKAHTANYNNLPAGNYVFEVRSTNSEGIWNDQVARLTVRIVPTFWETPWAWMVYALGIVLFVGIVSYILFYIYRLRHKVDVEQQLAEIKLRFFTDVSHELRTPLTLIAGPVDEVLEHDRDLAPLSRKHLELVQKNTNRMLRLVNQLLDFRKIQSRKMRLMVEHVNLTALLERIVENFTLLAKEHKIDYRFVHEPSFVWGWVDRDKFEKICYNLLSNAFKYTPEGKSISLQLLETEHEIQIKVADQGMGIPPEKLPKLFQHFEAMGSNSWMQPSSGIGLAVVKTLVELHHGRIEVDSKPGEGTTFTVVFLKDKQALEQDGQAEFILADDVQPEQAAANAVQASVPASGQGKESERLTLLVVEDNDELRAYLYNILGEDYQVRLAPDGLQGLNSVQEQLPDLIVSDVMMPVMDGLEMVKRIKQQTDTCHIPIILLSAKSALEDRLEGLEQGIDDYITKPFSASYLKARIRNLLSKRKQWQEAYRQTLAAPAEQAGYTPSMPELASFDQEFMERLMDFLEKNMDNANLRIEDLASGMNMSRAVFYSKLKTITGLAPIDFLRDIRIKRACQLIGNGDMPISQVAYMTGFNDPKFFSKTFRKLVGCSPTEYRETHKAAE